MIYGMLLQQQQTSHDIGCGGISTQNFFNMAVFSQHSSEPSPPVAQPQSLESKIGANQSSQIISKPTKSLPWIARFDQQGFSAQIFALPKDKGMSYEAAVRIALFGKLYSIKLQMSCPSFSFSPMFQVRNMVPIDSAMTVACRAGDFDGAHKLLTSGAAHGSDITPAGWPMLDVSAESIRIEISLLMIRSVCYREWIGQARPLTPRIWSSSRHGVWRA